MLQKYSSKQLLLSGKASDIKVALNSIINNAEIKNETLQQFLLQRPKMSIKLHLN